MKNRTLNCQLFFSKTNDFLSYYLPCQAARSIHTIETYRDGLTVFRRYITNVRKISIKKFLFTDCTSELMLDYLGYLNSQGCEASTCNNRLAALRAYLVCVRYGYLSSVDSVICISCTLFEGTKKGKTDHSG